MTHISSKPTLRVLGWSLFVALVASPVVLRLQGATAESGYKLIRSLPLAGEGGWDYLAIDPEARHLYVSRDTGVVVIDIDSDKTVGTIPHSPFSPPSVGFVHGAAIAREFNRGFISHEVPPSVIVFDLKTFTQVGEARTDPGPDAIIYDPYSKRVFTFNGKAGVHDATVIEAATSKVVGTIPLAGSPEYAATDDNGHLYVNLEDKSELAQIDSRTLKVTATWPLSPCAGPSGMAIDVTHRRLFVGCHNKLMAMVDADTGKVVSTIPIGNGVDANRFDPGTQLAFSSNGDGTLTIAHEDSPNRLTLVENVKTEPGARTMEIDPKTHRAFLVTAKFGARPAKPTPDNPHRYPPVLPNTGRLLIFGN